MVQPKKRLGQHFLTDPDIAKRIADALPDREAGTVLEIGPGKGILTEFLRKRDFPNFLAVEIDTESVDYLEKKWPEFKDSIISEDFLRLNLNDIDDKSLDIIGNFPYNISSQIFFKALKHKDTVNNIVCMIQKEVADRIVSPPGNKTYGILSVFLQAYFKTEFLFSVKPGSFYPPPKVTSSVIRFQRNETVKLDCDEDLFFRIVKATFNQRRKTIRNSIKTILLNLDGDFELLTKRPEQLSVSEFVTLTNWAQARL